MIPVIGALAAILSFSEPEHVFLSRPGQIVVLRDHNHDGDFLDFAESVPYADAIAAPGSIAARGNYLYGINPANSTIVRFQDANSDGDALDFGEAVIFAQLTGGTIALTALAATDAGVFTIDTISGTLHLLVDQNGDGDALDAGEMLVVGSGLQSGVGLSIRTDRTLLVAQSLAAVPVRILEDRDLDGDYLDFAENLSYVENAAAGGDVLVASPFIAYLSAPASGDVLKLQDLTMDGDALDFAEVVGFASGLPTPRWLAGAGDGPVFVACGDAAGSVYRLEDRNGDGDALDFGEAVVVALNLTNPAGLSAFVQPVTGCLSGDFNSDGAISLADVPACASAVLSGAGEMCRADINGDGLINGRDIADFLHILLP